jgi:quercetin dioxygenase-like cupin family protein
MNEYTHKRLPDVKVFANEELQRGRRQRVLVMVAPNGKVPLHTHDMYAAMKIVGGSAQVLAGENDPQNGRQVKTGDVVRFRRGEPHGFKAEEEGLKFVSGNPKGIVRKGLWDITFTDTSERT